MSIRWRSALIIAVAATAVLAGLVASQWSSYHFFKGKCLDCHLFEPKEGEGAGVFSKDVANMCKDCHNTGEFTHPVDVTPSMKIPSQFPLDWKGDLTCVSCHTVHGDGYGDYHLRVKSTGEGFCVNCHDNLDDALHTSALGAAHIKSSTGAGIGGGEESVDVTLDELSLKCMSCHDAAFTKDAEVENKSISVQEYFHTNDEIGVSHPIGVSYIEAKRKYKGAYRRVEDLPPGITLFDGIVGCCSCHNPYSKRHYELVMSNEGSKLCLACHVK